MIFVWDSQIMHVTVEQITDIDAGKGETLRTGSDAYSLLSFWKEKRKRMTLLRYAQMKRFLREWR